MTTARYILTFDERAKHQGCWQPYHELKTLGVVHVRNSAWWVEYH